MSASARILAIDEQPRFRRFLQGLFREDDGHVIVLGQRDELASRLAQEGPFDLVLIDVVDEVEWLQAVEVVRGCDRDVPLIAVCDAGDAETAVAVMKGGAVDFLIKPVERDRLRSAIARALALASGPATAPVHAPAAAPPPGPRSDRVVDENLRLIGRVSVLERALPLLTSVQPDAVADGFLELLCVEVAARSGALWLGSAPGEPLERLARWGEAPESAAAPDEPLLRRLESVRGAAALDADDVPTLWLPLRGAGRRVGVAQLSGGPRSPFGEREIASCAELADLAGAALRNALQLRGAESGRLLEVDTRLPSRGFFDLVVELEIHKAHRFGRRLCAVCIEVHDLPDARAREATEQAVHAMSRTLRTTDLLCSEGAARFWVLVTDTDPLGGVVLKRRLADRVREAIAAAGARALVTLGVASYPLDGETREVLVNAAQMRAGLEQQSVIRELGFKEDAPLAAIGERLMRLATRMPAEALGEIAEFLIGEITCRPHDSGLLFLAPGDDPSPVMAPLMSLGDTETAMEVFLATDGDTVPACPSLTAVALPPSFDVSTTWIVRFGEGPPYALVAGAIGRDGTRPIYHSSDPVLVEQMTFRLCAELGVGVRS